jgi:hypothetical protein
VKRRKKKKKKKKKKSPSANAALHLRSRHGLRGLPQPALKPALKRAPGSSLLLPLPPKTHQMALRVRRWTANPPQRPLPLPLPVPQ